MCSAKPEDNADSRQCGPEEEHPGQRSSGGSRRRKCEEILNTRLAFEHPEPKTEQPGGCVDVDGLRKPTANLRGCSQEITRRLNKNGNIEEAETIGEAIAQVQSLAPDYERGETFNVTRTVIEFLPSWLTVCTQSTLSSISR